MKLLVYEPKNVQWTFMKLLVYEPKNVHWTCIDPMKEYLGQSSKEFLNDIDRKIKAIEPLYHS